MKGKAHVYKRAHINTDEIIPARYLTTDDKTELSKHAMEDIDQKFVEKVRQGDFVVASDDFGCGSSREHAVWALQGVGVKAVIANTFARIFFRNAIDNGMLVVELQGATDKISNGDELEILPDKGIVKNLTNNKEYEFPPLPKFAKDMIKAGGLLNYIQKP